MTDSVEESGKPDVEKWRQVPDSERFQVSNWGNVRDLDDLAEDGKFEFWAENDMPYVWISEREMGYRGPVWKLVLSAWFRGILLDVTIRYKDGDPFNCRADNLVPLMLDPKTNHIRPIRTRRLGDQWVLDRRIGLRIQIVETGQVFDSAKACADAIGGLPSRIAEVLAGTQKSHRGYTFRRLDD